MSLPIPFFCFFIILFFWHPALASSRSTPTGLTNTSLFVASKQLSFWSDNVVNNMPQALLPKLSPLTITQSSYYASLLSQGSIEPNTYFCSISKLACAANLSSIRPFTCKYAYVDDNISSEFEQVDEHSFFRLSKLKEGGTIYVPNVQDTYPLRTFLPQEIASTIPMSLTGILKLFPQSLRFRTTKEAIKATVSSCNAPVLKGEIKSCPTSLEEMIKFAKLALDTKKLVAVASENVNNTEKRLMIAQVRKFDAEKIVSCHDVFLPFSTYFCHLISSTRLYAIDVVNPKSGVAVKTTLATCHMDTSTWPASHVAFKILNSSPGIGEACHWMTHVDLIFISDGWSNTTMV